MGNLTFKCLSYGSFKKATKEVLRVLNFRLVLKIYYRLSSKYLTIENVGKGIKRGSKVKLGMKLKAEGLFIIGSLFNSFVLLSMGKKAQDVTFNQAKRGIETRTLRKNLQF